MNYENVFKKEKTLEQQRQEKLQEYGLDDDSIKKFRSDLRRETPEVSEELGYEIIWNRNNEKIAGLVYKGADPNYLYYLDDYMPLIYYCIITKNLYAAKLLIKAGADLQKLGTDFCIECIRYDMPELLEILILFGVNFENEVFYLDDTITPIEYAKQESNEKCISILKKYESNMPKCQNNCIMKNQHNEISLSSALQMAEEEMNEILDDNSFQKLKK